MTTLYPLPDANKVKEILGMLFDGLEIKPGGAFDQTAASGAWYGVFIRDDGAPVAMCGADVNLAASFGQDVKLKRATIEMVSTGVWPLTLIGLTGESVTKGIEKRLPKWFGELYGKRASLDGRTGPMDVPTPLARLLGTGYFKQGF